MTHEVHTPPLPQSAVAGPAALAAPSAIDRVDAALEGLWQLLTSMRLAMLLMMVLAFMSLAGSLLIQVPGGQAADASMRAAFLESARPNAATFVFWISAPILILGCISFAFGVWSAATGRPYAQVSAAGTALVALSGLLLGLNQLGVASSVVVFGPGIVTFGTGMALLAVGVFRMSAGRESGQPIAVGIALILLGTFVIALDLAGNDLGLFDVFHAPLFFLLVAMLAVSLIACTLHRIPGAWRTATKPRIDVGPSFFEHAPQREQIVVHATSGEALAAVQSTLRKRHYRTLTTDDGSVHLYADRFRFMAFASLAGHISLVLILAGAVVGAMYGYRNTQFVIAEGATLPTGTEPGLSLKLIDFTDSWYTDVENLPSDYASQVELYKDGTKVAAQTIRVNEPLSYNGATYYQASYGSAAVVTVKDSTGKVVYDGGLPLDYSFGSSNRAGGIVDLPGTGNQIYVIGTSGTTDTLVQPGQVLAEVVNPTSSTTIDQGTIDQGKTKTLGGYAVTFSREAKYTVLSINRDPGQILVWLGALLLFGGFTLVFLLPQRRVWARISTRGAVSVLSIASLGRRDAALGTDFDALITDIRAALQAPAKA